MDISRLKKVLAGLSVAAISLTQLGTIPAAFAYSDVPAGIWYEEAVEAFTEAGYLDESQPRFRGSDPANRAEFMKLVVENNGGILSASSQQSVFSDNQRGAWYYDYINEAQKEGWVKGDNNCAETGTRPCYVRPGAFVNRAEAAALINRAFALEGTGDAPQFVDNPSGQWYTDAIQTAADNCVLQGDSSTGRVRPGDNMNRAEMITMLYRVDQGLVYGVDCGTDDELPAGTPAVRSVSALSSKLVAVDFTHDVVQASATTVANYTVTTGTRTLTISAVRSAGARSVELTMTEDLDPTLTYTLTVSGVQVVGGGTISGAKTFQGFTSIPRGEGNLQVAVSARNPQGDTVPKGAVGVVMNKVELTASCEDDVLISAATISKFGPGAAGELTVYAKDATTGARLTRPRSVDNRDHTARLSFIKPFTVPKCQTKTLDIVADFSTTSTTGAEHNLVVELPSDWETNARSVTGSFPLNGKIFRVAAVTAGTATVTYRTVTPSTIKVGDKAATVGRFEISVSSVADATLYNMTLEQFGTAHDGDVTNLKITRSDGTVLTSVVPQTANDMANFTFNPPFVVQKGSTITLTVLADIVGGAASTVGFRLEETSDLFAVDSLYGIGVSGQLYAMGVSTSGTATTATIDAGELTIEINGPPQMTYHRAQRDANLANIIFTTGGDEIDVKSMYVLINAKTITGATLANANGTSTDEVSEVLEDVTLRNVGNGRSISAIAAGTTSGTHYGATAAVGTWRIYKFTDFTIRGKETHQLNVDFIDNGSANSPKDGDQFQVLLCSNTSTSTAKCFTAQISGGSSAFGIDAEGVSTGDAVSDIRPGGTITGNNHRIAAATLTIRGQAQIATQTAVRNARNVNLMRFEMRAGEAKDILLTKLIVDSNSGALTDGTNYTLWVDTDGNGQVDTNLNSTGGRSASAAAGTVTLDRLAGGAGFVIPKGADRVFEVHSDIAGALTGDDLQINFATGTSGYIEAEEVDTGRSLTGIRTMPTTCVLSVGTPTTCDMTVTPSTTTVFKLVSQGDLLVSKDTVSLRNRQLLGGALADPILRLQFHSENEAIDVTDLQINSSGSTASSVERLELYKEGATTKFADATTSCGSDDVLTFYGLSAGVGTSTAFCAKMNGRQLVVPKGADVKVLVRPKLFTDRGGATSNQVIQLFITKQAVQNPARGSGAVRARGDESSNQLAVNDEDGTLEGEVIIGRTSAGANADIVTEKNASVLSKIVSITNVSPDAPGSLIRGSTPMIIAEPRVTAASNTNDNNGLNKVVLSGVIFNVTANNIAMDTTTFYFYNKANQSDTTGTRKQCTTKTTAGAAITGSASGSFLVDCAQLPTATSMDTTIDSGQFDDFVLKATITNTDVTAALVSTLQVSLQSFNSINNTTYAYNTSHLHWQDKDNVDTANFFWADLADPVVSFTSYEIR